MALMVSESIRVIICTLDDVGRLLCSIIIMFTMDGRYLSTDFIDVLYSNKTQNVMKYVTILY